MICFMCIIVLRAAQLVERKKTLINRIPCGSCRYLDWSRNVTITCGLLQEEMTICFRQSHFNKIREGRKNYLQNACPTNFLIRCMILNNRFPLLLHPIDYFNKKAFLPNASHRLASSPHFIVKNFEHVWVWGIQVA